MADQRKLVLEAPIGRALWSLAWPIALSNELSILSLGVLLFWLGRLTGETGLAVESLFRPLGLLIGWLLNATSIGVSVMVSRSVGAGDGRGMSVAAAGVTLTAAMCAAVAVIAVPLSPWIADLLAGDLPDARPMMFFLLGWVLIALPAVSIVEVLLDVANSTGATRFSLVRVLFDLAFMAALAPVLISYSGLGLAGAPISEGIAAFGLCVIIWLALRRSGRELGLGELEPGAWKVRWPEWKEILGIGLPVQAGRVAQFAAQIVLVHLVLEDGEAAVAGYGVALALLLFGAQGTLALAQAGAILVGQSLGAKQLDRARLGVRATVVAGWLLMAVFFLAVTVADGPIIGLFTSDAPVAASAAHALAIVKWAGFALATYQILLASFAAHRAAKPAGLLAVVGEGGGLVVALVWPSARLEAACVGFLAANLLKACLLLGLVAAGVLERARQKRLGA